MARVSKVLHRGKDREAEARGKNMYPKAEGEKNSIRGLSRFNSNRQTYGTKLPFSHRNLAGFFGEESQTYAWSYPPSRTETK